MSLLDKLPYEIRRMIYEPCLMYDHGDIIPFPTPKERKAQELRGARPANHYVTWPDTKHARLGGVKYREEFSCIALLGVNRKVQREAADILFQQNTWRISYTVEMKSYPPYGAFWNRYVDLIHHITTQCASTDVAPAIMDNLRAGHEGLFATNSSVQHRHEDTLGIEQQETAWSARFSLIGRMKALETLTIDVRWLWLPTLCHREEALETLCKLFRTKARWLVIKEWTHFRLQKTSRPVTLHNFGPWHRRRYEADTATFLRPRDLRPIETHVDQLGKADEAVNASGEDVITMDEADEDEEEAQEVGSQDQDSSAEESNSSISFDSNDQGMDGPAPDPPRRHWILDMTADTGLRVIFTGMNSWGEAWDAIRFIGLPYEKAKKNTPGPFKPPV